MQYTEIELAKLIETVESEFTAHLNKAESEYKLSAKSKSDTPLLKSEEKEEKDKKADEKHEDHDRKEEKEDHDEHEKSAKESEDHEAPCDYDEEDLAHMHKMYKSMSQAERKAHHDSIRKAMDEHAMGPTGEPHPSAPAQPLKPETMGKAEDGLIEPCPPSGTVGPESPASKANGEKLDKYKMKKAEHTRESGGEISETGDPKGPPGAKSPASDASKSVQMSSKIEKSEEFLKSELEAEKAKSLELKKSLDAVSEFLTKFVNKLEAPRGKAVTEIAALAKNEDFAISVNEMSKSDITAKLLQKSQDPNLSKSDREAINNFYLNQTNVNTISHLLKN